MNFKFSDSFEAAIEASNTARQRVIEEEQKLRQIEVSAQQKVATAKADAEATKTAADAAAYAIRARAAAEAEAQRAQISAFGSSEIFVRWVIGSKWNGQQPTTVLGDSSNLLFQIR